MFETLKTFLLTTDASALAMGALKGHGQIRKDLPMYMHPERYVKLKLDLFDVKCLLSRISPNYHY